MDIEVIFSEKVEDAENLLPRGPRKSWKREQWGGEWGIKAESYKNEKKLPGW